MEEGISGTEVKIEEIGTPVQIEEGKKSQVNDTEKIFNRLIEASLPNQKVSAKVQEGYRTPNRPEKKFPMTHNNQNIKCTEQ